MIKILGLILFSIIGIGFIVLGIVINKLVLIQMGGFALVMVIVTTAAVKLFPDFFESEENAKIGMKIVKKSATGGIRDLNE